MDRQKKQLAILAALVLALLIRFVWPWLSNLDSSSGVAAFGRGDEVLGAAAPNLKPLRLADLELKPGAYSPGRDPFRFAVKPPPPAAVQQPVVQKPPPKKTPPPAPRQAGNRQPAAPIPPPVDVTYLGSFGPERGKIAVFGDGTDIYNVRKGDILKEHFLVESINYESADLKFVNFPKLPATRLAAGK